jgi:4'-phosphopantetheinyl transferase
MPSIKIQWNNPGDGWGIWRIDETEQFFTSQLPKIDACPDELTNEFKRLEWLCGRYLLKVLFTEAGQVYQGISKNEQGKPFPFHSVYQLSLTNSFPYVAAQIHPVKPVGIDLEKIRSKLAEVCKRVLSAEELADAGNDLKKLCVYWSAKESLLKISGNKNFTFSKDLKIEPFELSASGVLAGSIRQHELVEFYYLNYLITDDFVLTTTQIIL